MSSKPFDIVSPETSVLIVDDSPDYAEVLRRILHDGLGYKSVVTIASPEDAYRLIEDAPERYRIVFLDYHFPDGQTGASLVSRLKEHDLLAGRVAFYITAEPDVRKVIEVNDNGLAGVVIKPFNLENLRALIQRVDRSLKMDRETPE